MSALVDPGRSTRSPSGGTGALELTDQDTPKLQVTLPSGLPVNLIATHGIRGIDLMRITPAGVVRYWAWDMSLSGNPLRPSGGSMEWDSNAGRMPDPATCTW
jgi:hypothetical protein